MVTWLVVLCIGHTGWAQQEMAPGFAQAFGLIDQSLSFIQLDPITISTFTGEKPQSKVWRYRQHWWMVVPSPEGGSPGLKVWRLDGLAWTPVLTVHPTLLAEADVVVDGPRVHLIWVEAASKRGEAQAMRFTSLVYDSSADGYRLWPQGPGLLDLQITPAVETVAMDKDSAGRLWIAYEEGGAINVRFSRPPYTDWQEPLVLNSSAVAGDDICDITAFGGDRIGVLWSDQNSGAFYFRYHEDVDNPQVWSAVETAWQASGWSTADDHISLAASAGGTIYAAVKTGVTDQLGLLIRNDHRGWENHLHVFDVGGTRPIVLLGENPDRMFVFYNLQNGYNDVVYRQCARARDSLVFGPEVAVTSGEAVKNVSSVRNRFERQLVVLAGSKPDKEHRAYLQSRLCLADRVLPAELNDLWAWREGGAVVLYWRVAGEILDLGFVIERADSPAGPFEPLAGFQDYSALVAQGAPYLTMDYQWVDEHAPANRAVYYRLSVRNYDGKLFPLGLTHVSAE